MTKVILSALVLLLAAENAAGVPVGFPGLDDRRLTGMSIADLAAALHESPAAPRLGGWAGFHDEGFAVPSERSATPPIPASGFATLVTVNRLEFVERTGIEGELPVDAGMELVAPGGTRPWAALRAASGPDRVQGHRDEFAVLGSTQVEVIRSMRTPGRQERERKFWSQPRPLRGAQVWLARKQP
jgi:hypothetical protein